MFYFFFFFFPPLYKPSSGGVVAMICGSKGWGSLAGQADWATDSLDILSIEVKTARNLFKPSKVTLERVSSKDMSPFLGSVNSKTVTYHKDGWEEYRMLMPPVYKVQKECVVTSL
jgi:hypothetical protein